MPVAPEVVRNILQCQKEMAAKAGEAIRWAPEEQIHLTLKFLGNISLTDVEALKVAMKDLAKPLRLRAEGVGGFPSRRNPRVIWVGLTGDIEALKEVQSAVETAAGPYCAREENRPFRPHLTIGRVREGRRVKVDLDQWKDQHFGEWEVRELLLMQSKLSPKGATHSVIAKFTPAP
jgi:RNA 2',3'-cyclic 3'-phosphodiesterase